MKFECRFGLAGTAGIQNQGFGKVDTRGHLPDIWIYPIFSHEGGGEQRRQEGMVVWEEDSKQN